MKKVISIMFAALIITTSSLALFGQGAAADKLASGNYVVYARSPQVWRFIVDAKTMANAAVSGHFTISEGTPKNIDVFILDEDNFKKWSSDVDATHASAKPLFTLSKKDVGDLNVKIAQPGAYYLVFSDMFQYEGTKGLTADVKLQYDKK
jgi:hypothetical protein